MNEQQQWAESRERSNLESLAIRAAPYIRAKSNGQDVANEELACGLWVKDYDKVILATPENQPFLGDHAAVNREAVLREALERLGRHEKGCYRLEWGLAHTQESDCTCGLYVALNQQDAQAVESEAR